MYWSEDCIRCGHIVSGFKVPLLFYITDFTW